jgi:hypothetical protein
VPVWAGGSPSRFACLRPGLNWPRVARGTGASQNSFGAPEGSFAPAFAQSFDFAQVRHLSTAPLSNLKYRAYSPDARPFRLCDAALFGWNFDLNKRLVTAGSAPVVAGLERD